MKNEDSLLSLFIKPSKIGILLSYILIYFIGSSFIMAILALLIASKYDCSYMDLINHCGGLLEDKELIKKLMVPASKLNAYTMAVSYGLTFIFIVFYARNYLKEDFIKIKSNPIKSIILILSLSVGFYLLALGIDALISLGLKDETSVNQSTIEDMILLGSPFASFLAVVVFAPLIEELVYRKLIFEVCNKKSIILSYVISTLIFGMIHMVSTQDVELKTWILLSVSYLSSGLLLCAVYHISDQNVWISTIVHILNNLLSFIFIII